MFHQIFFSQHSNPFYSNIHGWYQTSSFFTGRRKKNRDNQLRITKSCYNSCDLMKSIFTQIQISSFYFFINSRSQQVCYYFMSELSCNEDLVRLESKDLSAISLMSYYSENQSVSERKYNYVHSSEFISSAFPLVVVKQPYLLPFVFLRTLN